MIKVLLTLPASAIMLSSLGQGCNFWSWADSDHGSERNECHGVASDNLGNTYVAGWFDSDNIVIGGIQLNNHDQGVPGAGDIYVAKLDAEGNALWAHSAGGSNSDWCWGMAVDQAGSVIITGEFYSSSIAFGSTVLTNNGSSDMFMAKYDSNGNLSWAHSVGSVGQDRGLDATFDPWGNAVFGGDFQETINVGIFTLSAVNEASNGFVAKYNSGGEIIWATGFGSEGSETVSGVAADLSGNIYACGSFSSSELVFGGNTFDQSGQHDAFVLQILGNGAPGWCKAFGSVSSEWPAALACSPSDEIIVCGDFDSPALNIGGTLLSNSGNTDGFMVKYSNTGTQVWAAKCVASSSLDAASDISCDENGHLFVTGHAGESNTQFGNGIMVAQEGFFLTRYDNSGQAQWAYGYGGDVPASAAWDRGLSVWSQNGITVIGGYFMSDFLLFDDLEVLQTADMGNVQSFFSVFVSASLPVLLDESLDIDVCEGEIINFACWIEDSPLPTTAQWFLDGLPLEGQTDYFIFIGEANTGDSGTYLCTLTNACGSVNSLPKEVTVLPLPALSELTVSEFCETSLPYTLPAGTWSGPGVNGNLFLPSLVGTGSHALMVSATSAENCTNTAAYTVEVFAQPNMGSDSSLTVCDGDPAFALIMLDDLLSADADASGNWYTPDFVLSGNEINPSALGAGTYGFVYFNPDFGPCEPDTAFITISVVVCLGTKEGGSDFFNIYPNPATQECLITLAWDHTASAVSIFDISGKCVYMQPLQSNPARLDLSALSPGMYCVAAANHRRTLIIY